MSEGGAACLSAERHQPGSAERLRALTVLLTAAPLVADPLATQAPVLTRDLKALLSIRAVLTRAGVNDSRFYIASRSGSTVVLASAPRPDLRAAADELRAAAERLGAEKGMA